MPLKIIGAGVGRTGTYSLKLAINQLGLGPCHHMEEVLSNMPAQVPLWAAAVNGRPDWEAVYNGYESAVDWPTAGFFRELSATYPTAKFVLTHRSPESWAQSFSQTIYKLMAEKENAPKEMQALSPHEARRLLEAAGKDRLEALYVLAIHTGMRQGELLALRWQDMRLDIRQPQTQRLDCCVNLPNPDSINLRV